MTSRTFLFVDQSSPKFFRPTSKGLWLIKFFSDVRYVDQFRRYSRWTVRQRLWSHPTCWRYINKSIIIIIIIKVVRNLAEIWTFFGPREFLGADLPKVVHALSSLLRGTSSGKFSWGYSHQPEVIEAHTLNFKPNFKFSRLKFFGGTPVPAWVCAR